jgi:hypothetical protein
MLEVAASKQKASILRTYRSNLGYSKSLELLGLSARVNGKGVVEAKVVLDPTATNGQSLYDEIHEEHTPR